MENLQSKILIIDDDVDLLMLLERRLNKEGYWVESAVSLSEGRDILHHWKPELVLLDININGEDGRCLAWELKSDPHFAQTPVILISGFDTSHRRAALFHADTVLPKPLDSGLLIDTLRFYLQAGGTQLTTVRE